jgi:hypothetical protein
MVKDMNTPEDLVDAKKKKKLHITGFRNGIRSAKGNMTVRHYFQ